MFSPALLGHMRQRERFLERVQAGRLTGTLLLAGPEAVGKRRAALELPQRELCFRKTACGACEGCRLFDQDPLPTVLPNLLRIAPEGKAGLIKVGAVRDDVLVEGGVISWAHQAPPPGCHRWILVEDAHRLNGAAANMLLKTLEEPPPGTHFLLVTHRPEAVLQTIRSRAERIPFTRLTDEEAWEAARRRGWGEANRARWTALAEGTLRFLDEGAFQRAAAQVDAWLALLAGEAFADASGPLLPDKDSDQAQGEQVRQALELLLRVLDDAARVRAGRPAALGPWGPQLERAAAGGLDLKAAQDTLYEALRSLTRNPGAEPLLREVALSVRP